MKRNSCSQVKAVDTSIKKWMILPVLGQSNAVGYDESPINLAEYKPNPRIQQLGYHRDTLQIVDLGFCADNYQDMTTVQGGTKGIHYKLAEKCLEFIPQDYGVLILPCAFGGTTIVKEGSSLFTTACSGYVAATITSSSHNAQAYNWGMGANKYTKAVQIAVNRVKHVLDNYPGSKLLGLVWCQGEHTQQGTDTGLTSVEVALEEYTKLINGIFAVCARLGIKAFDGKPVTRRDVYVYDSTKYWVETSALYNTIIEYYKKVLYPNNVFLSPKLDSWTNEVNGTGATSSARASHYGNDVFAKYISKEIGSRICRNYRLQGVA